MGAASVPLTGARAAWPAFAGAVRIQAPLLLRTPTFLMVQVTVPAYTVIFLSVTTDADRPDLAGAAVLAPVLIALWGFAIWVSGMIVRADRWYGTLEGTVATPTSYATVLAARVLTVTAASGIAFAEAWLTAWIGFDVVVRIHHPWVFVATAMASLLAMAGTAVILGSLFVLSRVANTFASSVSYPFYVLGGVLVPVALLPAWIQPASRLVFLSWSADLLRASLDPGPVVAAGPRVAAVVVLGLAGWGAGAWLLRLVLHRVRVTGELGQR